MARANLHDSADAASRVRQLHGKLRDARTRLTAPTVKTIDECRTRLEETADALGRLQTTLPSHDRKQDAAVRALLLNLRAEINRVALLLDSAAAFHAGWMRLAASMAGGYTDRGTPVPAETGRRLWTEV